MTEQEKRKLRVCFTGHRPEKLNMSKNKIKSALLNEIIKAINDSKLGTTMYNNNMLLKLILK